jgi:hypothetical protein
MPAPRYPLPAASALAEVRWLLDDARARAASAIPPARRSAVIALDGAIESALWLVARALGQAPSRRMESFDALVSAVRSGLQHDGVQWREPGLDGILQLRQARNGAQHAAVRPEAVQLAEWADAAAAFVDGLLEAAFGVTTGDVGLALAIGDHALREELERAEQALRDGDAPVAFERAWTAFEEAVQRWTRSPAGGPPTPATMPPAYMASADADLRFEVARLRAFQDVQTFASDLGEYLALRRIAELLDGPAFTAAHDDALRAIRFTVTWIARWEAFERGYPDERWRGALEQLEPPADPISDGPAVIGLDAHPAVMERGNERWAVDVQLANVPDRARGEWGRDLLQCFADAVNCTGATIRLMGMSPLSYDGRLRVMLEPEADAAEVATVLHEAVRLADERHRRRIELRAECEAEASRRFEAWSTVIVGGSDGLLEVSPIRREVWNDGEHYRLTVGPTVDVTDVERLGLASVLREGGDKLAGIGAYRGSLELEATSLSDEDLVAVRAAAARAAVWLREQQEQRLARAARLETFAQQLRALVASP